ncbi:PHP domain-containing protein [Salinirubellus salinus]|uniref:PHP domain-containing protein n=1 Tax=Salinirubellus salinus TaxID=1364945 RepID=A0A9E7R331_9EURY|nr:PHP domain-containing protein [Salinirubellus salinus]UWM54369.1 PHP domain-containing protein [Salinirubellus salinus]
MVALIRLDLQTHTRYSPSCGWMPVETLVAMARRRGLDGVAVTDHNTVAGVHEALGLADDGMLIVPAEEVDTPAGQIIGLFVEEEIRPWQPPEAVIDAIHDQGGLAFAPHPFDRLRQGLENPAAYADALDAFEVFNARCVRPSYNDRARSFAREWGLPGVGGSDAHFAREVGNAYTVVDVDIDDVPVAERLPRVKTAIRDGRVRAVGTRGSLVNHAGTKVVKLARSLR